LIPETQAINICRFIYRGGKKKKKLPGN